MRYESWKELRNKKDEKGIANHVLSQYYPSYFKGGSGGRNFRREADGMAVVRVDLLDPETREEEEATRFLFLGDGADGEEEEEEEEEETQCQL